MLIKGTLKEILEKIFGITQKTFRFVNPLENVRRQVWPGIKGTQVASGNITYPKCIGVL